MNRDIKKHWLCFITKCVFFAEHRRLRHRSLRGPGELQRCPVAHEEHGSAQREHCPVPPGQPGPLHLPHLERW
jgi:hypothetical protein